MSKAEEMEIRVEAVNCAGGCGSTLDGSRLYLDGVAQTMPPVTCDKCIAEDEAAFGGPALVKTADPLDWLQALGVNTRKHGNATFSTFDGTAAPRAVHASEEFAAEAVTAGRHSRVRGLYLVDQAKGTGKSHLAVAIMQWVHERRPKLRIVFDPSDRLITRIQDSYGTGTTDALIEKRRAAGLYVLDDLGREKGTDDALRTLATILDEREGAPTVITSNALPHELARRYHDAGLWDRVASRLGDVVYRYVRVPGRDRRFTEPVG